LWGAASDVPWAGQAGLLVVRATCSDGEEVLVEIDPNAVGARVPGRDLTGAPRETLTFEGTPVPAEAVLASGPEVDRVVRDAAVLRCAALSGAMTAARASAGEHVRVRHQFGRPLARLQAVAHHIARIGADVALAEAALEAALGEAEAGGPGWRALAALVVHGRSTTSVARMAHQCLGAMGITKEHPLHRATLRLWAWRDELVPTSVAERRLGWAAVQAGCEQVWDWCVHETAELGSKASPWRDS
jgi:alkylation response protein AidB-like acyl-CoA dehydrogenase